MAILTNIVVLLAVVALLLRSEVVLGKYEGILECKELTARECAFAVSSAGARCVLEKSTLPNGEIIPSCQTSLIMAERPGQWIESNKCIRGCGLERETYGLSTDLLIESGFRDKLCSSECQNNCPNIVDIYNKLAAGEGVYLPRLCNEERFKGRRLIDEPVLVAQNGPEGGQRGRQYRNSDGKNLDTSVTFFGTASPQPSRVYGVPRRVPFHILKEPDSVSSVPSPSPSPTPGPSPSPSPSTLSQPIEDIKIDGAFGNDFEDGEI